MSGAPQVHIFFGAPILKASKDYACSTATAETWSTLYLSFTKDTFSLCTRKYKCASHADHQTQNDAVLTARSKGHCAANFKKRCELAGVFLTDSAADIGNAKSSSDKTKMDELTGNSCHVCGDASTEHRVKHHAFQQLPNVIKAGKKQCKQPAVAEGGVSCEVNNPLDSSPLLSSIKNISRSLKSLGQNDEPLSFQCNPHRFLSQYLEICCPQVIKESKTEEALAVCSSHAISAQTEFLSILTSSQVAVLSGRHVVEDEMQSKSTKMKGAELDEPSGEGEDPLLAVNKNGMCSDVAERDDRQDWEGSLELFSSDSDVKENCPMPLERGTSFQENVTGLLHSPADKNNNEIYTEPWKGVLCSQGDNSPKRPRASEDTLLAANFAVADQQLSKKAKLICSPVCPAPQMGQLRMSLSKKPHKHPSLLKDCSCKGQKYNVLVTILHPCHIKEIQVKAEMRVPLATIVVFDQSEVRQKIVFWRTAAFWSLMVLPGDIVLLTDVRVCENRWTGETMLESTFTSRVLNLGSCSTVNWNEFSHIVDANILQDLLAYVSSKHAYLQALPKRQPQSLNSIQHILLDQLKPDTLVHAVVKIVDITVLTESTYTYKGESHRKIILIVEQGKDQRYALVLWGNATVHYPQLQRKRGHIWEFKYLFAKHNPVSGELELHTTPWSSFECLFDDDRRTIEFKEKFEKGVKSLRVTSLAAHLEEKCSGIVQVRACISELTFTISSSPCGQLVFDANTSLQHIFASLSLITYAGCAKCGLELQTDDNKIYKQCFRCLPSNKVKIFYRPAVMVVEDGNYEISVQVVSHLMEKIFLNIPASWLNKAIEPSLDTTYGMVVADLCHSLVTDTKASYLLEIRSHFVLDENSYPLEKDFHLLGFHLDL